MKQKLYYVGLWYNRSTGQTEFLFELCSRNLDKLLALEHRLKHHYMQTYVPTTKADVYAVLQLPPYKNLHACNPY